MNCAAKRSLTMCTITPSPRALLLVRSGVLRGAFLLGRGFNGQPPCLNNVRRCFRQF